MIKFWKQNTKKTSFKLNKKIFLKVFLNKNKNNILKKKPSEGFLKRNSKISYIVLNYKDNITPIVNKNQTLFINKNLNSFDFFLYQQFNLLFLNKKKQNFYFFKDFVKNIKNLTALNWYNFAFQPFFNILENKNILVKEKNMKKELFALINNQLFLTSNDVLNNNVSLVQTNKQNLLLNIFLIKNFFIFKNLFFSFTCNNIFVNKFIFFYFF